MAEPEVLNGVPQYTRTHYETRFADRHLVHDAVRKWASATPRRVAIVEYATGREFTYGQFDVTSTALALRLLQLGFRPGDFLAAALPLLAEHIFLEYACLKIGVIHAPLDLRLKTPEVLRLLGIIQPKGFAFWGRTPAADFGELGQTVRAECAGIRHFIQCTDPGQTIAGAVSISTLLDQAHAVARTARVGPHRTAPSAGPTAADVLAQQPRPGTDLSPRAARALFDQITGAIRPTDGAQVIFTTGSTGLPKPALLSHRNITCQNMCMAGGFGLNQDTRMLVNLPPSHVGCQAEQMITTWFVGGTAIVLGMFDAEQSLRAMVDRQATCFGQVPAMFQMQWRLPNYGDFQPLPVRKAIFGGQQVSRHFVEKLLHMVPQAATGLGLTEMAGFVTYTGITDDRDLLAENAGWPMPITPLSIRQPIKPDGSAGDQLPAGQVGEICFGGPQVFIGYVNNAEAYRRTVSTDGICYTGDLGLVGSRGLVVKGRSKLVIKPKGYQVHPAEIESHFAKLKDQIVACGAVGAPHEVFSEGVVLFIERRPGAELSLAQLDQHARGIAGYMRPSHYVFVQPGKFPLNRLAKTDYLRLQELAQAEIQRLRAAGRWDRAGSPDPSRR